METKTDTETDAPPGTKLYTVTKHAGPKVAGRVIDAGAGAELYLTENEARSELLSGAVVAGKKGAKGFVEDPLDGSKKLDAIQQNANPDGDGDGDKDGDKNPPATPPKTPAKNNTK